MEKKMQEKVNHYLDVLCKQIGERPVGSDGNRKATRFLENELTALGWKTQLQEFDAIDWNEEGASLTCGAESFEVLPSPYSPGVETEAPLLEVSTLSALEEVNAKDKVILLHGEIAAEQLMPKNFVFYNPEHHQQIIKLLEESGAKAIITATGRNSALAGGVYPFPMIEDGDFNVPSVYTTEETGRQLAKCRGKLVKLKSTTKRIPAKGYNVTGIKGNNPHSRLVITAHIDAKKGTPGAIDNATGVIVLLLLAQLLADYRGAHQIELIAFNGEDYYSVPGQMKFIEENREGFDAIFLNINIDGVGYNEGPSSFALLELPDQMVTTARKIIEETPELIEEKPWPQGDHSIFLQYGRPAVAVSSHWLIEHMEDHDITHTPKDHPGIVDSNKVSIAAHAIERLVREL